MVASLTWLGHNIPNEHLLHPLSIHNKAQHIAQPSLAQTQTCDELSCTRISADKHTPSCRGNKSVMQLCMCMGRPVTDRARTEPPGGRPPELGV